MKQQINEIHHTRLEIVEGAEPSQRSGVLRTVKGVFSVADSVSKDDNRNKRLYSSDLLKKKIVESSYTKEMLANKTLFGEASHPANRFEIYLPEVSHCITSLQFKEGVIYGTADILDTPAGRVINTLVEYGSTIGISSRGAGTTVKEGEKERVNESDYVFFTYDFVPCPSFKSSRLSVVDESIQLINEAQEFINHPNLLKAISEGLGGYDASQLQIVENVLRYADSEYFSDIITEVQERVVAGNVRDGVTSLLEEAHQQIKSLKDEIFRLSEGRDTSSDLELERRLRRCIEQDLSDISERTYFLMDAVADVSLQLSSARETVNESQEIVEEKEQEVSELRHELSEVQTKSTRISADYLSTFALLEKKEAQTSKVMQEAKRLDERMDTLYEEISTQRLRAENYAKLLKESIVNAFALPLNEVEKLLPEGFTKEDFDVVVAKLKARVPGSTSLVERKTSVKAITEEKNIAQEESVAISLLKNIRK